MQYSEINGDMTLVSPNFTLLICKLRTVQRRPLDLRLNAYAATFCQEAPDRLPVVNVAAACVFYR